jgi:uncharacterized membrane protein YkvA (DUF1232 family)
MTNDTASEKDFDQNKINEKALLSYQDKFSKDNLLLKLQHYGRDIGLTVLYNVLQLWYVLQKPEVPAKNKAVIMGALGYLITPLDFIPDLTPILGYNDDAAAILFALYMVRQYVDDEVKTQAKARLAKIFSEDAVKNLD